MRIQVQQQCQPFAPAIHHKIAEAGHRALTAGKGSTSLIIPARIIGTEHKIVTRIVSTMLSISVSAASNLDIIIFRRLDKVPATAEGADSNRNHSGVMSLNVTCDE